MTRVGAAAVAGVVSLAWLAGCGTFERDTGRRDRRVGEATHEQRMLPMAGVPVDVFIDQRNVGTFATDTGGKVRVDLRRYLGPGPRIRPVRVEFLIHDPAVNPPRVELIAPPGG